MSENLSDWSFSKPPFWFSELYPHRGIRALSRNLYGWRAPLPLYRHRAGRSSLRYCFSTYQRRTSRLQAYSISLNAVFVLLAGMVASSYILKNHPIAIFLLPVLYLASSILRVGSIGHQNTVFTLRQTKRLSGLISTGAN